MKRGLICIIAVFAILLCPMTSVSAAYENTYVLTGDQATDLVGVAKTQVGYWEGTLDGVDGTVRTNYQKYGVWYDETVENIGASNAAWEASFVLWCADQAGIDASVIPQYAYVPYMLSWYEQQGLVELASAYGGTYTPKVGDLIFFKNPLLSLASHVGMVTGANESYIYTVEGNAQPPVGECVDHQAVVEKKYSVSYSNLYCYARPAYTVNQGDVNRDGVIDTNDARDMLKSTLGQVGENVRLIDLNGDGVISTSDTRQLLLNALL